MSYKHLDSFINHVENALATNQKELRISINNLEKILRDIYKIKTHQSDLQSKYITLLEQINNQEYVEVELKGGKFK